MDQRIEHLHNGLGFFADRRQAAAEENREHHDLQNFVARHRINDAGGYRVRDKHFQGEGLGLNGGHGSGIVGDKVDARAWLEQIDDHQTQRNRQQRGANKQEKGFREYAPERFRIAHFGDADHQR